MLDLSLKIAMLSPWCDERSCPFSPRWLRNGRAWPWALSLYTNCRGPSRRTALPAPGVCLPSADYFFVLGDCRPADNMLLDVDGKPYTMRGTDIGRKFVAKGGAFHKGEFWTSDSRERNEIYRNSCLSQSDIEKYVGGIWKRFYCWRVYAASQTFPRECANPPQSWRYDGKERNRILMSINPKWLAKILNGEKTIEVRKTAPKELVRYERE